MTIDVRAVVTCNLGELISASISDDYIQGNGLIKTSGNCEINGIITPSTGSRVFFEYTKSGITRRVPRTMRVLSSFADPFRRITTVELGCALTYLQDLKDPIRLLPRNDEENAELTSQDAQIITLPTYASSVMRTCLNALGLQATSIPLTNKFSVAEFDLSSGYVDTLSNLLVSESFCGYLDQNERLNIISLTSLGGSGPLIASTDLIDVGPIGVGQLPGDAVLVSYSTLKLVPPEDEAIVCRSLTPEEEEEEEPASESVNEEFGGVESSSDATTSEVVISYTDPITDAQLTAVYRDNQSTYNESLYRVFSFKDPETEEESRKAVVIQRKTYEDRSAAGVAGGLITQYLSNGIPFGNFIAGTTTIEQFAYDAYGNETFHGLTKRGSAIYGLGLLGLQMVFTASVEQAPGFGEGATGTSVQQLQVVSPPNFDMLIEQTFVYSYTSGNFKSSTTKRYGPWAATISGQQSIAESRDSFQSAGQVQSYINMALSGRGLIDVTVSTQRRRGGEQAAPLPEEQINEELAEDTGNPDNGFRTQSVSETEFATGSSLARRRIELSMPYAPDDTFRKILVGVNPTRFCYYSSRSDAPAKAARYGRAQNRLLLGNRSGMNIQIAPEKLPNAPFAPVFIEAAGTIALYRVNAASWTIDSTGIVASTDAMFWGTAGRI
jgi:hypothetical protein